MDSKKLHPLIRKAAKGKLPEWARAGPRRREHVARVAKLMGKWARAHDLSKRDRRRWKAAGLLHDALRDASPRRLRKQLGARAAGIPGALLHGPAAALRLEEEGVRDPELLQAVRHHTRGHPEFGILGLALYAADFLEPGRADPTGKRKKLRKKARKSIEKVAREVEKMRKPRRPLVRRST